MKHKFNEPRDQRKQVVIFEKKIVRRIVDALEVREI